MITATLADIWPYFLVGGRFLGMVVFFPGISGGAVPPRFRAFLALGLTLSITPFMTASMPAVPQLPASSLALFIQEMAIGMLFSLTLKAFFSALDIAGSSTGYQIGLSNAFVKGDESEQQNSILTSFLHLGALTLFFATGLHFHLLSFFIEMYRVLPPHAFGSFILFDFFHFFLKVLSLSFTLGVLLAGPMIIISVLNYLMAGIINRLVPQMQVFFIIQPLQIMLGLGVLTLVLPSFYGIFMDRLSDVIDMLGGVHG